MTAHTRFGIFVRSRSEGHQVYVVYPVIAENVAGKEETELKAAIKMYRELSGKIFPELKVGLLHGRLDSDLKDQVMRMFQKGELQILVATTVIEVGVDVPNATVMGLNTPSALDWRSFTSCAGALGAEPRNPFAS